MFEAIIKDALSAMIHETLESKDKDIRRILNKLKREMPGEDLDRLILPAVVMATVETLQEGIIQEDFIKGCINDTLHNLADHIQDLSTSYVFHVAVVGLEDHISRDVEIPATLTLDQLIHAVLAAFHADGRHLYMARKGRQKYESPSNMYADDDGMFADEIFLKDMSLRKNSKLTITYDMGDNYEFLVTLIRKNRHDHLFTLEHMSLLDGRGSGIWEDAHYLLEMCHLDYEAFCRFVNENDLRQYFDVDGEWFDLETANDQFYDDFMMVSQHYADVYDQYMREDRFFAGDDGFAFS